jgi:hypothetical protein
VTASDIKTNAIVKNIMDKKFGMRLTSSLIYIAKLLYMVIKFSDGEIQKLVIYMKKINNMIGEILYIMTKEDNSHKDY